MSTSAGWSKSRLGSITRPPLSSSGRITPSRAWPRRRARDARDGGVDLDAAVHGPRVHDGQRAWRLLEPLERDAEDAIILPHARDEAHLHALELQAQHVQHVGPLDRLFDAAEAAHAQVLDAPRHQRIGTAHPHLGAELGEAPDVGARDAGVQYVATRQTLRPAILPCLSRI